jgi:glutamyl-tRNA synthetase
MSVVVRFAPSPTGYLHIGGARTALFNWLFARHHGGRYLLRIEDTDRQRSTQAAIDAIFDGLGWLGLQSDEPPVFQFERAGRHAEVAQNLLAAGKAYHCWATPEELDAMRARQREQGLPIRYDGRWRDRDPSEAPPDVRPVVRLRAPQTGVTRLDDLVQGEIDVANAQLDDMVLLRADGTPTYMLSVVVDDIDMAISHVIRGHDHLTNTFRQVQLYQAIGAEPPRFGHIPLIHGPDGAKLSKRHGALSVTEYREMGFLPEAVRNYLLRLGWSHGDEEIMSTEQAIALFDLGAVGRAPARFDLAKLTSLNAHYLRERPDEELVDLLAPHLAALGLAPDAEQLRRLAQGMPGLKQRSRTLVELAQSAAFYVRPRPIPLDEKGTRLLDDNARAALASLDVPLAAVMDWSEAALEGACRAQAETQGIGLGKLAQPLRVALTGTTVSPGVFEVMRVLGRSEVIGRIADAATGRNPVKQQLS